MSFEDQDSVVEVTLEMYGLERTIRCSSIKKANYDESHYTFMGVHEDDLRPFSGTEAREELRKEGGVTWRGVSQAMADDRCEHDEEYPKRYVNEDTGASLVDYERVK